MNLADVTEFIIVPPFSDLRRAHEWREALAAHLRRTFRGYAFRVPIVALARSKESFTVVPVMNFLDDSGEAHMCNDPPRWLLADIHRACDEFASGRADLKAEVHSISAVRQQ